MTSDPTATTVLLALSCCLGWTAAPAAQVPRGHYVVSGRATPGVPSGLWLHEPRAVAPPAQLTNVAPEITAAGCADVEVLDDGRIAAVAYGGPGAPVTLHVMILQRTRVIRRNVIRLGVARPGVALAEGRVVELSEDLLLVGTDRVAAGGPLGGRPLASFDRITGALAPLPFLAVGDDVTAVAAAPGGGVLWVARRVQGGTELLRIDRPSATTTRVATSPEPLLDLEVTADGRVLAATGARIVEIDTAGGGRVTVCAGNDLRALSLEPGGGIAFPVGFFEAATGAVRLAPVPTAAGGTVAVRPNPATLGTPSGAGSFRLLPWRSVPQLGNTRFALRVDAAAGDARGVLLASARSGLRPTPSFVFYLDPASAFVLATVPADGAIPLPIPLDLPPGGQLALQSFHADARAPGRLSASNGMLLEFKR